MSPELYHYYTTEYPKCNISNSFLSSWQGLAYPCHLIQIIALPLQILTFYVIWKHTPTTMKTMKGPLLVNHFWCSVLDLLFCSFVTPYLYVRFFGFFGVGLLGWMGMPVLPQIALGVFSAFCVWVSYIYVFESRSSSLQMNRFKISKPSSRIIYLGLVFIINCSIFPILFSLPKDQEAAKLDALKMDPCPTVEFFDHEVLIVITDPFVLKLTTRVFIPGIILNVTFNILFHVMCTVYYLFLAPSHTLSEATQRIQKKFFMCTVFQTIVPMITLFIPLVAVVLDQITRKVGQDMINLGVIGLSLHGVAVSITIVLVHRPYRIAVWSLVTRSKIHNLPRSR